MKFLLFACVLFVTGFALLPSLAHASFTRPPNNLGLQGYWSFNEATSTTAGDSSGNKNTGTLTNIASPPTSTSGWAKGKIGSGIALDSTNDVVEVADSSSLNITSALSIALWVKFNSVSGGHNLVGRVDSAVDHVQYLLSTNGDELLLAFCTDADAFCSALEDQNQETTNANLVTGQWYHVVVTYSDSANQILFYVDGQAKSDTNTSGTPESESLVSTAANLHIGENYDGNEPNATLDEVRIYNRALTTAEVTALYAREAGGPQSTGIANINASSKTLTNGTTLGKANGLVGLWTFDGGDVRWTSATAGSVTDGSATGNTGTLTSMTRTSSPAIGKLGQALSFVSGATFANVDLGAPSSLQITGSMTVSMWAKAAAFSGGDNEMFGRGYGDPYKFSSTHDNGPTQIYFQATGGVNSAQRYNATTLVENTWYHLVAVYDASVPTVHIYLNGALDDGSVGGGNGVFPSSLDNSGGDIFIGQSGDGAPSSSNWNGVLDDVRVYNRALSASEVKQLYQLGAANIGP